MTRNALIALTTAHAQRLTEAMRALKKPCGHFIFRDDDCVYQVVYTAIQITDRPDAPEGVQVDDSQEAAQGGDGSGEKYSAGGDSGLHIAS